MYKLDKNIKRSDSFSPDAPCSQLSDQDDDILNELQIDVKHFDEDFIGKMDYDFVPYEESESDSFNSSSPDKECDSKKIY